VGWGDAAVRCGKAKDKKPREGSGSKIQDLESSIKHPGSVRGETHKIMGVPKTARGQKVMLDRDLAELYAVETGALNRAVKRNIQRFPEDFMFQITDEEAERLRCQTGISKRGRGGRRYLPYVFTEQGVAMFTP